MPKKPCGGCRPLVRLPRPPFASPFDPPRAPPFGGSHEGRDCTTSMREETTAPARLSIEGGVTHGNGNNSGSAPRSGSKIRKESPEAAPRAEQRLLRPL